MSMPLNTATMGIFKAIIYICRNNFILTFPLEKCLVYQINQVQYFQSHKSVYLWAQITRTPFNYTIGRSLQNVMTIDWFQFPALGKKIS